MFQIIEYQKRTDTKYQPAQAKYPAVSFQFESKFTLIKDVFLKVL